MPAVASARAAAGSTTKSLLRTRSGILLGWPSARALICPPTCPTGTTSSSAACEQERGVDYEVLGRSLVFPRPIAQEGRLGFWRWLSMWLGVAGTYRKHENVDVVYELNGRSAGGDRPEPVPFD